MKEKKISLSQMLRLKKEFSMSKTEREQLRILKKEKQEDIKRSFESKEVVENIDLFSAFLTKNNNIQHGKSGTIPTKYKKSKEDIEAISRELLKKISTSNNREA